MKHDSKKHVVPVWTICKGRKFVHLPLSPPIEMSKKHLGLLFSDIFPAKCVQERENSHCTRGRTRGCLLPRDTQEDTADQTTDCQTKWRLLDDRISKTIILYLEELVSTVALSQRQMSNKVKTAIFIGGFAVFTLGALYPVVVYPKLHPEVYREYG